MGNDREKLIVKQWWGMSRASFLIFGLVFVLGAVAASVYWNIQFTKKIRSLSAQIKPLRQSSNPYTYINPLLGYDVPGDIKEFNEYKPLEQDINDIVKAQSNGKVTSFSVYFRDLSLGRWVGINEDMGYAPASLMKVAIMIAYFKEAETDPSVLQKSLAYSTSTADEISAIPFETPSILVVGKSYTVEKLIEAMITTSDNGAKNALLGNVDNNSLNEIYTDLGLPNPANTDNYKISPKQYSLLLRVLYNATYLSRQYSEEALKILSQAEYGKGLVAGVPSGTVVAQKFGENVDARNPQSPQISLSNCGIIYESHPYIFCAMTLGTDLAVQQNVISAISQTVWKDVSEYVASKNY